MISLVACFETFERRATSADDIPSTSDTMLSKVYWASVTPRPLRALSSIARVAISSRLIRYEVRRYFFEAAMTASCLRRRLFRSGHPVSMSP